MDTATMQAALAACPERECHSPRMRFGRLGSRYDYHARGHQLAPREPWDTDELAARELAYQQESVTVYDRDLGRGGLR